MAFTRSEAAQVGGLTRVVGLDDAGRRAMTEPARSARKRQLDERFRREVDPDGVLAAADPDQLDRLIAEKWREHGQALSAIGVAARQKAAARRRAERDRQRQDDLARLTASAR